MSRFTQQDMKDDAAWESRFAAIEVEAAAILAAEGEHHVRGVYFVLAGDAYMARMIAAEQIVAKRDAIMDSYIARGRTAKAEPDLAQRGLAWARANYPTKPSTAADVETPAPCPEMSVADGAE